MPNLANPSTNRSVRAFLDRLEREHFYGIVAVRYENGNAVHIRREESILPTHLMENPETHESNNSHR
jgi:hypothetical protein